MVRQNFPPRLRCLCTRGFTSFLLFIALCGLSVLQIWAQGVSFSAKAPASTVMGERLQVTFILNNAEGSGLKAPDFSGFDLVFGPAIDTSEAIIITNTGSKRSQTTTYTYTLLPQRPGSFTIGAATIRAGGKNHSTRPMSIKVLPADKKNNNTSQTYAAGNLYLRLIPDRTKVYKGEGIPITLKVFASTNINLLQLTGLKLPDFSNFVSQEIAIDGGAQVRLERVGDKNMQAVVLKRWLIFPQQSGTLRLPSASVDIEIALPRPKPKSSGDLLEDFFDQASGGVERTTRSLSSSPVDIDAAPLPTPAPPDFSGAVGHFSLQTSLIPKQPQTNEAARLIYTVTGSGNIKFFSAPKPKLPDSFDSYDAKDSSDIKITPQGAIGQRSIEYLFVPRETGKYTIPATDFSFFDPADGTYKTLTGSAHTFNVTEGKGGSFDKGYSKEDVKLIGQDIRFIKAESKHRSLFGSAYAFGGGLLLTYLLLLALAGLGFTYRKRSRDRMANIGSYRRRHAGNRVMKQLASVRKHLAHGTDRSELLTELRSRIHTYIEDKLCLESAESSRKNIVEGFARLHIDHEIYEPLLSLIDTIEFERFAPEKSRRDFATLLDEAIRNIQSIESHQP